MRGGMAMRYVKLERLACLAIVTAVALLPTVTPAEKAELVAQLGHSSWLTSVAVSPDSKFQTFRSDSLPHS